MAYIKSGLSKPKSGPRYFLGSRDKIMDKVIPWRYGHPESLKPSAVRSKNLERGPKRRIPDHKISRPWAGLAVGTTMDGPRWLGLQYIVYCYLYQNQNTLYWPSIGEPIWSSLEWSLNLTLAHNEIPVISRQSDKNSDKLGLNSLVSQEPSKNPRSK